MPLQLHIFEERYKRMINLCIQERRPFGAVLIRRGLEALGDLAEPYQIGCTAQLIHVQKLEQDRMNLVALGQERFVIHNLDRVSQPYLMGQVEIAQLSLRTSPELAQAGERLRRRVEQYIQLLLKAGGRFDLGRLPQPPVDLAYVAAGLLDIAAPQKQALLELDQAQKLLEQVQVLYAREQALLKAMLAHAALDKDRLDGSPRGADTDRERGINFSPN